MAYFLGVVFLLSSHVPSAAGTGPCELTDARDSTEILMPPDYETFLPPTLGNSYCDPVFGTEVKRLTDTQNGYVTNSEIAYFNLDDSYFIATDGVGPIPYLFDGRDGHKIKALGTGTMRPWWIRWPRGNYYTSAGVKNYFDPTQHFYKYEGNQVRLYDVETLNYVVLRTFGEYSAIGPAGGEGDVSQDGRYWVLDGTRTSDGQLELFVYDLLDDQKESVSPFEVGDVGGKGVGADFATVSPSGNYIVIAWDAGMTDPYNGHYGVEVFDRATWEFVSRAHVIRIHVELGFDAFGEEVVFTAAGNTPTEIATFGIPGLKLGDQLSVRMRDGFARMLLGIPRYAPFVLSYCPGQPDYIFVGYMDRLASEPWNLYWGEIFALATDGSGKTVRMVHHRSRKVGSQTTKAYQPDFFLNNRGDKIIMNSTYGIGGADLYMFDTGLGGIEVITSPNTPSGPTTGTTGTSYSYSSSGSSSSLGHSIQYYFDWGDGLNSGWLSVGTTSASHSWASAGTYSVKAQARCATHTSVVSGWSGTLSVNISAPGTETVSTPTTPSGPSSGTTGTSYSYSSSGSSSSLGHSIQYYFDWGDGSNSGWLPVGTTGASHSWASAGTYLVKAQARCATHTSVVSGWSGTLSVDISAPATETVSTPTTPSGPNSGTTGTSYSYSSSGSSSNLGHSIQYFFDWGDGSNSGWLPVGTTSASHSWASAGTYLVKAQARCATHTSVVSGWSGTLSVSISSTVDTIFSDVPAGYWAEDYINAIYNADITTGCSQNPLKYCPEDNVTREQMAAFIVRAVEGEPPVNYCTSGTSFPDVTSDMWSCRYIKRLKELGITTGYQDGTYGPYDLVPREQMAAFVIRAVEGEPPENHCASGVPFPDVASDMWSCDYIKRLKELNITTGYGDGTYGPYDLVTRAQMAAFLARAFLGME